MRRTHLAAALLCAASLGACRDFLTGGDLSNDPNRSSQATSSELFVGIEANLWAELSSDPARVVGLWTQQFEGTNQQYTDIYNYGISEQVTNGFHTALYTGGGLVDIRRLEAQTTASRDSLFLGIAQVSEALLIGTGADLFGDITYSQALTGVANPILDPQLAVYDSVQTLLSRAIVNLAAHGPTNFGPGQADLAYGGDGTKWTKLAHTLKARYFIHTAEVRPAAYASALAESKLGIISPSENYVAQFSGAALQQNLWYQFDVVQRPGYLTPNPQFVALLKSRNDPRLAQYFNADQSDLADALIQPDTPQPLVTSDQNLLVWSESAQRGGDNATALTQLNAERAAHGLSAESGLTGRPLLAEILTEEYIADFQSIEVYNLYRRTCSPNLTPVVAGLKIPARFPYDASERNTNTNIPPLSQQPARNANDPANATSDATGAACLGQ